MLGALLRNRRIQILALVLFLGISSFGSLEKASAGGGCLWECWDAKYFPQLNDCISLVGNNCMYCMMICSPPAV